MQDTCYDLEDGNSGNMNIHLRTSDLAPLKKNSWLQFDTTNQEFYGVPLKEDVGETEYILECLDRHEAKDVDALVVRVFKEENMGLPPAVFGIKIAKNYHEFMNDARGKAKLIQKIAMAFGDRDASNIRIMDFKLGSVVVNWYNSTLPFSPCPNQEIKALRSVMLDENGNLKSDFVSKFRPDFYIKSANVVSFGECLAEKTPTYPEEPDVAPHPPLSTDKDKNKAEVSGDPSAGIDDDNTLPRKEEDEEDYLLTFIVPAVIIAVMLLLAALIACCLYRRRRYGKMTMSDDRTFVSKGIPIIFAEELDDPHVPQQHRGDPAKSPIIMKDEKPPLPPPQYPAAASPPSAQQPLMSRSSDGGEDTPYYPPPPCTNSQSRNQRPNMPPAYRKPPTYVPP